VARAAASAVGPTGVVVGLDINPGMLATAQKHVPPHSSISWYEASIESMPLPDHVFDVVLCQMGLQFVHNRAAAVGEMRRVLIDGGRALVSLPGPAPDLFAIMIDAVAHRIGPDVAAFGRKVFSLHDNDQIHALFLEAGFHHVEVESALACLEVPEPKAFLWQYIASTPMIESIEKADGESLGALERDITNQWQQFCTNGGMNLEVRMTTAIGWA
jgi:ubiquinone/menaquinone biosynthesis C-methylase UbiE